MKKLIGKMLLTAVVASSFIAVVAWAASGTPVLANQGQPGNQGPWPVTLSGGAGSNDGGFVFQTGPVECRGQTADGGNPDTVTTVGTSSTPVPASAAVNRAYVSLCVSLNNVSPAVVKCISGGAVPTVAAGPGQVIGYGDCVTYTAIQSNTINCISDGGYVVTAFECVPQ